MKKIMFNDKYGLTQAVLDKRKNVTRRIVLEKHIDAYYDYEDWCSSVANVPGVTMQFYSIKEFLLNHTPYKIGEVVAIAQSYKSLNRQDLTESPGYNNKMFVKSSLMPYKIEIQSVKVERLQDITYDDCLKEGIIEMWPQYGQMPDGYTYNGCANMYQSAEEAYADLIDQISGKGTWGNNPFVYRIEFKLFR